MTIALFESRSVALSGAVELLSREGSVEERGAVFTKAEVVDGILDLCGYRACENLLAMRLLEPAAGDGAFVLAAIDRLMDSIAIQGLSPLTIAERLRDRIVAVELHHATFERTTQRVVRLLADRGIDSDVAEMLARCWIRCDDFLLTHLDGDFDVVVGNPPYVRQERIPAILLAEYKRRFTTLYDRADLYVLFFEKCLHALKAHGTLGFICSNRWIKNKYGGPLRRLVASNFNLNFYIDLERTDAFSDAVDAYAAVTIIQRAPQSKTIVFNVGQTANTSVARIFDATRLDTKSELTPYVVEHLMNDDSPWLLDSPQVIVALRSLEARHPTIESSGGKIRIGVASGADKIFIGRYDELAVEPSAKVPLAMSEDLSDEGLSWGGLGMINPWDRDGSLKSLSDYPLLAAYLTQHRAILESRHTARERPDAWYRTIDRIYPDLLHEPKLLIPDIKGGATIGFDAGTVYPHHNLYCITSATWCLPALQTILRSSIALAFVAAYSVRMSGGFLRFQAQYLRRIRVPHPESLPESLVKRLADLSASRDQAAIDTAVAEAFRLDSIGMAVLVKFANQARAGKAS